MRWIENGRTIRTPGRFYVVQFGDSLYTISQRFDVQIEDIVAYNEQLLSPNTIFPGEVLYIPSFSVSARKKSKSKARSKRKK